MAVLGPQDHIISEDPVRRHFYLCQERLAVAVPACSCSSCKVKAVCNPQSPTARNRIGNAKWVSGPQKIIGAWFSKETFTPAARNKISNAKWAGCQWPKKYVESQMHICNNQAVAQSGGLNRTTEEGTSSEVKFSLTHFSKHYSEKDTASDPADSDTNEGETGPAFEEGKTGPVSSPSFVVRLRVTRTHQRKSCRTGWGPPTWVIPRCQIDF